MKWLALVVVFGVLGACGDEKYSVAKLQDPNTCNECHPNHMAQWSGSMHAYASDDPVFVAMNKRGQRETNGELGTFCLNCHAPMAVKLGLVTNANAADFDPAAMPPAARGITCYFCHNVDKITADHNNGLELALDQTMRGGAKKPVDNPAHHSSYDTKMASATNNSEMCGSCHDVVLPSGVDIERTFKEWKESIFSIVEPQSFLPLTCSGCHMQSNPAPTPIADKPGLDVPARTSGFHDHYMASIDTTLTPDTFPDNGQHAKIEEIRKGGIAIVGISGFGPVPPGGICLDPPGVLSVRMDTIQLGHKFPSGVAHDRRAWLHVKATRMDGSVVFESGNVMDGQDPEELGDPAIDCTNPTMACTGLWERAKKADGTPAHFFWEIASYDDKPLLKAPITRDRNSPLYDHSTTAKWNLGVLANEIDRIEATVYIRPLAFSIIDELVASGDLDATLASQITARIPTHSNDGARKVWTRATKGTGSAKNTNCNPYP